MARFMRKGVTKIWFVPSIASPSLAPTAAEVNAGTDLTGQMAEVTGFTFSNNPIDTPDMSSSFVSKIGGEDATEDSSVTFYEDKTSNPIMTAMAKGTNGFVVIFAAGIAGATPAAGDKADVWPVTITSNARQYAAGNEAAKYQVKFATTAPPGTNKTLT